MRYEDASHTGAFQGSEPVARDDFELQPAGARDPATGNVITGEGTQSGPAGADQAAGAKISAIAGHGGEDSSFSGGQLSVSGEHGRLMMDAEGNFSYRQNAQVENVRDRFTYTLADNQGNSDTAALIIEIGKTPVVIKADAQQIVPGPDGVVTLPPGVELSDVRVVGRNLVVDLPDGTQLIIIDGAVFVPQLVINGVEIPATNIAALLIGQEIQPAAGETPPSSGGNFAVPPPPLDPGVPLGDLIPPTEYTYVPPEPQPTFESPDDEPEIFIQPDGQPASVAAVDSVDERGLPTRNGGEPEGSGEEAAPGANGDTSETTTGTILIDSPDGVDSVTINGVLVTGVVGQTIAGAFGTLTITGFSGQNILYSYTLNDNTSGDNTRDDFSVTVTDDDGDQATATLTINIVDDVPTARPDTDAIAAGQYGPVTGNVITDASPGDIGDSDNGRDTVGADNASITSVSSANVPANSDGSAPFVVNGQYGVLTLQADGSYSYVRNPGTPGGVNDVFNYTLTDGDGDTSTTTLTISIADATPQTGENPIARTDDDAVPGAGGNPGGTGDDVDAQNLSGNLAGSGGDGPLTFDLLLTGAPAGFTYVDGPAGSVLVQQVQDGVTVTVLTITINSATGAYTVTQNAPIEHPTLNGQAGDDTENNVSFTINYTVTDVDGDSAGGTLTIDVDDDTPIALVEVDVGGTVDEDGLAGGNVGGVNDVPGAATVINGNVSALFSAGADQPLTYSLSTDTSGLPALTSNGAPVTYSVVGNTLTASANGSPVFTLVLNADTGEYTFTLLDQLDHPSLDGLPGDDTENPADQDLTIQLGSIIQATDSDGDSVTADANGLNIIVDDDSPEEFEECPDDVITVNEAGSTFTGNLNLPSVGADQPGVVSFGVSDGDPVLDEGGNPLTSNGEQLFYFINDQGVLEARAGDETGDVVFTITLNGDGTYTFDQFAPIGSGGGETPFSDLTSASAGNIEFRGVGADDPATQVDLLLSASNAGGADITVNTDSDSIGSGNQSMDNGESVRIDFVSNLTTGAATPSGFGYSGHVSTSSFIQLVPQVQGNQDQTTAFTVWALNTSNTESSEPDRNPAGGFSDSTITAVVEVTVKDYLTGNSTTVDVSGFTLGVFTPVAYGISVRVNADGSVTFSGVQEGDSYGVGTGAGEFNAVVIQAQPAGTGGSTQDSFDLGIFSIGTGEVADPVAFCVPIALTDADGDSVVCDICVDLGPPVDAPDVSVTVNEAGLPLIGSDADSNSEIQSGDLQPLVTGGTGPYTFVLVGSGDGAFGTLVLNADGTFTYTLDTPFDSQPDANDGTNPELGAESFTYQVTDSLGAVQTGTITINIIDDVPTAIDDTDALLAGELSATGNVITDASPGDAGDGDNGADTKGADGATVAGLASVNIPANVDNNPAGGFVVVGQHGTLTMQADGSYSYVRLNGNPGEFEDVFTYTLTDGDGDLSTATLTITIEDAGTSLDVPTQGEAGTLVDEQGLPTRNGGEPAGTGEAADGNSSDNDDTSETTAGVISFTAPDGPATVTIDGVVVTGTVGQTFNGAHGVLTITSYNAGTGQIGYSYTLTDNTSGDATFDDFAVVVTDNDGDSSNATLVINIVDDTPIAVDDTDSIPAGQYGPAVGNVITDAEGDGGKDNVGADNAVVAGVAAGDTNANLDNAGTVGVVIQGTYGKLTLNGDGSYSYVRDPGTDGGVQDVFTYTLKDGDGDLTNATLTITIADSGVTIDAPDQGEAGTVVDEKGLPSRPVNEPAGSGEIADGNGADNDDTSETTAGVINFTAPDGPAIIRIDGVVVTGVAGQTFVGTHGTLTITSYNAGTGQIGYSYTLADNTSGDATFDDFVIQVEDQDGDIASDTLVINIIDDVPTANDDVDSVVGGFDPATGNVLTGVEVAVGEDANATDGVADVTGADNARVSFIDHSNAAPGAVVPNGGSVMIAGDYGVLTIYSNGDYSYARNPGSPGGVNDVFTYTLLDGDGDTDTATLTISIDDNFPTLPDPATVLLDDDVIPGKNGNVPDGPGDDGPDVVGENVFNGSLAGSGGDGSLTYSFTGTNTLPPGFTVNVVDGDTRQIMQGTTVVLTIDLNTSTGAFTVTQNNPILHPADDGGPDDDIENNLSFSIGVQVADADGDTDPATITINVDDDTPTINVTQNNEAGIILTTDDAQTIGGATDTASSTANFSSVFALSQSAGADGAAAPATLSYSLDVTGFTGGPGGVDSGLDHAGNTIFLYEIGGKVVGSTSLTLEGVSLANTVFDVMVDGNGVVTLTQYSQVDHIGGDPTPTGGPPFADHFVSMVDNLVTLTASSSLTDNDGDTVSDSEVIGIGANLRFTDDGPDAVNDSVNQVTENSAVTVNVFANDSAGADGVNIATGIAVVPGSLTGTGVLVDNNDGTFTYTPGAGEQGSVTFQYQLTDFDGDTDIATVTINLQPDSVPNAVDNVAKVDDDGLPNGLPASGTGDLDANSGEAPVVNPSEAVWHGQLSATSGNDTIASFTFASMHGTSGSVGTETVNYSWSSGSSTLTATISGGARNGQVLFNVVINQSTGEYNLTLLKPVMHVDEVANQENDATTNLTFTVTDSDGDTDTGIIVVTFDDDMPQAIQPDSATLTNEAGASTTADLDDDSEVIADFGADGPGLVQFANITNGQDSTLDSGGVNITYWLSNNGQTLQGRTNSTDGTDGQLIFTVQINQASGDYTVTMTGTIDNGSGITFNNLTSTKAGNVDVRGVGADNAATPVDLLLTASKNGANATINTDSDSIGSDNQSMDAGETVRVDFVTNLQTNAGLPSGFSYSSHVGTNSLLQTIPQVQGNQNETVAFRVYALNTTVTDAAMPDDTPGDGFSDSTIVNTITHVTVDGYAAGEGPVTVALGAVGVWTTVAYGVFAQRQADGSVIFTGIQEGDQYGITTSTDFNAFAVTALATGVGPNAANRSTTDSFDLGVFAIGAVDLGDPVDVSYDLQITDADGDTVLMPGAIDITFEAPSAATSLSTMAMSSEPANDGGASSFSFTSSNDNQKWGSGNGNGNAFGNNGSPGITAAMVAASGFAGMSMGSLEGFNQPSLEMMGRHGFQSLSTQVTARESMDSGLGDFSLGVEAASLPSAANLSGAGFSFEDFGFRGGLLAGRSSADDDAAYVPNYSAGNPAIAHVPAFGPNVPTVSMASAEALAAANGVAGVQRSGVVEQLLADALGQGGAPTVDALLHGLTGGGSGGPAAFGNGASPAIASVPAWDTGMDGAFGAGFDMVFKMDAALLHHDVVQPVING